MAVVVAVVVVIVVVVAAAAAAAVVDVVVCARKEDAIQPLYCQELDAEQRGPSADERLHRPICPHTQRRLAALTQLLRLFYVADWDLFA